MANQLNSNPAVFDTTGSLTGLKYIREIQWIDDSGNVANGEDLVLTINGVTVTRKVQMGSLVAPEGLHYHAGPFNPGIPVTDFTVTTIDNGILVVWLD